MTRTKQAAVEAKTHGRAPRFDIATLRELAGGKVFARGVEYYQDEQVEIVSIDKTRVFARVIGSEVYRCELEGAGKHFSGECSCPAFSDWGFCKHLVATALAANELGPEAMEQAASSLEKVREHLRAKGVEPLVGMIMDLAERDPSLLNDLKLAAATESADDKSLFAQFKKAITEATRTHGFVEFGEARAWAQGVESVLDRIERLIGNGRAELASRLLDYFFARMDDALQEMDDSDGQGGAVYEKGCEIHLAACRAAKPDPVALARDLFAREVDSDRDFFHGASEFYAEALGDAGLAEYRRLASEAWKEIKPLRAGGRQLDDERFGVRFRLAGILESFAERDRDIDGRIAIRVKDLSTAYAYLGIAQLCLDHDRKQDALKWAEEGLWQFEDHPDERLVVFAVDLYERAGRKEDAAKLLWRTFERLPSIELYRKLKAAAGAAADATRDRAIGLLRAKLGKPEAAARWSSPRELLVDLLISEKLYSEAWEVVRHYGCADKALDALAQASEKSHPAEALMAYARAVERLASLGGQGNYQQAAKIIARMRAVRRRLGADADHAAYLADLMNRHRSKRNLMKLLQASG